MGRRVFAAMRGVAARAGTIRAVSAPPPIPVLDLTRYDEDLKREIARRVEGVPASGRFVLGPANEA